jgi:hypothetical protein
MGPIYLEYFQLPVHDLKMMQLWFSFTFSYSRLCLTPLYNLWHERSPSWFVSRMPVDSDLLQYSPFFPESSHGTLVASGCFSTWPFLRLTWLAGKSLFSSFGTDHTTGREYRTHMVSLLLGMFLYSFLSLVLSHHAILIPPTTTTLLSVGGFSA